MPRPSLSEAERAQRRSRLLTAAHRLYRERQELPTVAQIAEAAGVAKGTVYLSFGTKEEILIALLEDGFGRLSAAALPLLRNLPATAPEAAADFAGRPVRADWFHNGRSNDTFTLQVTDMDGSSSFSLDFDLNCEAFSEEQSERTVAHYLQLLDALLADPRQPLSAPEMLPAADLRTLAALTRRTGSTQTGSGCCTSSSSGRWSGPRRRSRWSMKASSSPIAS